MAEDAKDVKPDSSPDEAAPDAGQQEDPKNPDEGGETVPRSRFNEVIKERNALREKLEANKEPEPEDKPQEKPVAPSDETSLSTRDFLKLRKEGYSDNEVLNIVEQSETLGVPVSKLIDNPLFKKAIEAGRSEAEAEQATPAPSQASVKIGDKPVSEMTNDEKRKNWDKIRDQYIGRGGKSTV